MAKKLKELVDKLLVLQNAVNTYRDKIAEIKDKCELDLNYIENGSKDHSPNYPKYDLIEQIDDIQYKVDKILEG